MGDHSQQLFSTCANSEPGTGLRIQRLAPRNTLLQNAMVQLETPALMIGGNHPPETTGRFIAAKFEHDTARPVDGCVAPQLHTHAVVLNVTERDNGQSRAVQPQSLFASQQFATAVYQSESTYRLRHLGYEIAVGRSGAAEIKGYTQEYLDSSSPRCQQIREYLERTGRSGKEAAEIAALSTRDRKEIHSPSEVMAAHRKLAADLGHQAEPSYAKWTLHTMVAQFMQLLLQPHAIFHHLLRPCEDALAFRRESLEPASALHNEHVHVLFQLLDSG